MTTDLDRISIDGVDLTKKIKSITPTGPTFIHEDFAFEDLSAHFYGDCHVCNAPLMPHHWIETHPNGETTEGDALLCSVHPIEHLLDE